MQVRGTVDVDELVEVIEEIGFEAFQLEAAPTTFHLRIEGMVNEWKIV